MKNLRLIVGMLAAVSLTACAARMPLLSTPIVSMTKRNMPKTYKPKTIGPVSEKYCFGDEAMTKKGDSVGLMDEVIMKAQKSTGANFIQDANFAYEGASCIVLEGTAIK